MFVAVAMLVVLVLLGGLAVIGFAAFLRRYLPRLSLPVSFSLSHSVLVLLCIGLYPTDIFFPSIPFDDVYISYLIIPGLHIYWLATQVLPLVDPYLMTKFSFHTASLISIVFIPGLICLFLGGIQWYFIGGLWQRRGLTMRWSERRPAA